MTEQERIFALMRAEKINAKTFSKQVGISPATMSNIQSGRNKPSLEIMQRILNRYRTVSTNWLILGVGPMYLDPSNSHGDNFLRTSDQNPDQSQASVESTPDTDSAQSLNNESKSQQPITQPASKQVLKFLIIYNDGTFDEIYK